MERGFGRDDAGDASLEKIDTCDFVAGRNIYSAALGCLQGGGSEGTRVDTALMQIESGTVEVSESWFELGQRRGKRRSF